MITIILYVLAALFVFWLGFACFLLVEGLRIRRELERWERYRDEQGIHPDYSLEDEE